MTKINKKQNVTRNGVVRNNPVKLPYPKVIKEEFDTFKLKLVTYDHVFYATDEGDDDGGIKMFNRNMKLVSDNYFASEEYTMQVAKNWVNKSWVWASADVKKYGKYIYDDMKGEL